MPLIHDRGEMWARNTENIEAIPGSSEGGRGIYVLFDGSMPVYIGRGNIRQRIRKARASEPRGQAWDHCSWYIVLDAACRQELEVLLLRMLPPYLRMLTRQRGKLAQAHKHRERNPRPEPIKRPNHWPRRAAT